MTQNLVNTRTYRDLDEKTGKIIITKVNYRINIAAGKVVSVFNEFNHSILSTSETFEYYSKMFNQ